MIKGICLKKTKKGFFVHDYFIYDLKVNHENLSELYPDQVRDDLNALFQAKGLKKVSVGINCRFKNMTYFCVEAPLVPENELSLLLQGLIEEQNELSLDHCQFEFHKGYRFSEESDEEMNKYSVISIENAFLNQIKATVLQKPFDLQYVESDFTCVLQTMRLSQNLYRDGLTLVFDWGYDLLTSFIVEGTNIVDAQKFPDGIENALAQISHSLDLSIDQAEKKLRECDFSDYGTGINPFCELIGHMFEQIHSNFTQSEGPKNSALIKRIILTGGGANYKNIHFVFERIFGIETIVLNPFKSIEIIRLDSAEEIKLAESAMSMATAVGLALKGEL